MKNIHLHHFSSSANIKRPFFIMAPAAQLTESSFNILFSPTGLGFVTLIIALLAFVSRERWRKFSSNMLRFVLNRASLKRC